METGVLGCVSASLSVLEDIATGLFLVAPAPHWNSLTLLEMALDGLVYRILVPLWRLEAMTCELWRWCL